MRRKILCLTAVVILVGACQFKLPPNEDQKPHDAISVERFDRLQSRYLTTGDYVALQQMSTQYPIETRTLIEDILQLGEVNDPHINSRLLSFYQDTTLQSILAEVQAQYLDMADIDHALTAAFQQLRRLLPTVATPRVYAQVGDLSQSIVINDSTIGISLDKYLGADFKPYTRYYNAQQRATMTRADIVPDCVLFYLLSRYPLKNFETRTQDERNEHMGRVMWVSNLALGKSHFSTPQVKAAADLYHSQPRMKISKFLTH